MTESIALGGLVNMGLTCYANAVIQCLRHCEKIPWIFTEGRYSTLLQEDASPKRTRQQELCKSFASIIHLLETCRPGQMVRPSDFWIKFRENVVDTAFDHLLIKTSHDSNEFYVVLLDLLHESLSHKVDMRVTRPPPTTEAERHCVQALETWRQQFHTNYSPLVDLFNGLMHKVTQCTNCKNKSHRWETFSDLKAAVPANHDGPPPTIIEMIQKNFEEETIDDYACDHCQPARHPAKSRNYIWRLPLYVAVNLKRFTNNGRRIDTPVAPLPSEGETPLSFQPLFSAESPEGAGNMNYIVHAIIDHHGSSTGGHYTAQCRKGSTWTLYDDESTRTLQRPVFGTSTYMVWFTRSRA